MKLGKLRLPNGALIIDYNKPAQVYFDYELAPRDVLSKLAFLGAISQVELAGDRLPTTGDNLQAAGIGRKSLDGGGEMSGLMGSVLVCDADRFKILDGAPDVMRSSNFTFDDQVVTFANSDSNIYENTLWVSEVDNKGRVGAYIADIARYAKIGGEPVTNAQFTATVSEGGIGWFLAAILLKVSICQGKFELSIPELF